MDAALGGASRAVADIGSHWCDTVQYVTGRRITEVMADLSIVWPTRKANVAGSQTFTHDEHAHYEDKLVTTEDFGSVLLRFDDGSKGCFSVSQVSAGRKFATFHDGASVMYILDAIVKSHQQQRWVRVEY